MNDRLHRIAAVARVDFLVRFRRVSTLIIFLLLTAFAYVWVPAPSTGRALIQVAGQRALYNSAAVAMGTALLATLFVGLVGFYVISNALRRDVDSRCGFVIASTPIGSAEYLFAKFVGNLLFLVTFVFGYMLVSMVMVLVRGEAPLEPFVFVGQYLLITSASIVFVAVVAVVFESVPWLSGRFGDVLYFFLWATCLGLPAALIKNTGMHWLAALDFSGMGFVSDQFHRVVHTDEVSVGSADFDASKGIFVFQGFGNDGSMILMRIVAAFVPIPLLGIAWLFFHRFDPMRVRKSAGVGSRQWSARINGLIKPLARTVFSLFGGAASHASLGGATRADTLLTLNTLPLSVLAIVGFGIAAFAGKPAAVLPVAFATAGLFLSDIACREKRAGTMALIRSTPFLKERFVLWKLLTACSVAMAILALPVLRAAALHPAMIPALAVGIVLVCVSATALGVITGNPKTFIVLFLTFWYVCVNDAGHSAALDFAGFYGKATPAITFSYLGLAIALLAATQAFYRMQLRRET